jgi:hypothetical protein
MLTRISSLVRRCTTQTGRIYYLAGLLEAAVGGDAMQQAGQGILPLASVSRPALGLTQPPVQWVHGVFLSPGVKRGRGVTLTTHPHLVPRSRLSRSYTSSPAYRREQF